MKTKFIYIITILCIQISVSAQSVLDSLEQDMLRIEAQQALPGFAVAIVSPDEILFESGYGFADIENKKPYTPNTLQNIGSVSKTFIAGAIAKCIEDGLLSLDTKINDVLPFQISHPDFPNDAITVRHLVTHTSGIQDSNAYGKKCYVKSDEERADKKKLTLAERRDLFYFKKSKMMPLDVFLQSYLIEGGQFYKKKNFTETKPGQVYKYSNIASALAAYIVEFVTKKPFDRYVVEEIMKPLGMESSGYKFDEIDMNQHAVLYSKKGGIVPKYSLVTYPDGGVLSSTHDLATYTQQMMKGYYGDGDIISSESYSNMFTSHFEKGKHNSAIFWGINKHGFINHNGADPGIFTCIRFHPEENFGMVFTTNCAAHINEDQIAAVKVIWKTLYKRGRNIQQ